MLRLAFVLVCFCLLSAVSTAGAQAPVTVSLSLEPARATVGDRLTLTITVEHPPGARIDVPDRPEAFAPLELLEVRRPQTSRVGGGREQSRFEFVVAAFASGEAQARPLPVAVSFDGQRVEETLSVPAVSVESVLPPGEEPELRDLGEPLSVETGAGGWLWAALAMAGFVAVSVLTMSLARFVVRERPSGMPRPSLPADAAARAELDALANAGLVARAGITERYRRLGAAVRSYLAERYSLPPGALTARELAPRLEAAGAGRWAARLAANLLQQCDAVQFARYQPADERAQADLASAYEIVELTQPEAPAAGQGGRQEAATP